MKATSAAGTAGRNSRALLYGSVLAGFLVPFAAFFLVPVFLSTGTMQFFQYVPAISPIGVDLKQVMTSAKAALAGGSPYAHTNNLYPPMAYPLVAPLVLAPRAYRYALITAMSLCAYLAAGWFFPRKMVREGPASPLLMLVFTTGLLSYGLQFELERGQFNVIAVAWALLAAWLFHRHPRYRLLAYAAFTVAVQLKLYPLLFALLLIDDWRDWKGNLRRLSVLGFLNFALLFVLGPHVLVDFLAAVSSQSASRDWIWPGNHAIHGFVEWALRRPGSARLFIPGLVAGLTLVVVALVLAVVLRATARSAKGMDAYVLAACGVASLLVPAISNDYTLSTLAGPVACLFMQQECEFSEGEDGGWKGFGRIALLFLFSAAFGSTLFSYTSKPGGVLLGNMLPALVLMLVCVAALSYISPQSEPSSDSPAAKPHN